MKYFLLIALIGAVTGASIKGCEKVTTCPAQNPTLALHLPNPDDCGSFCKCDFGTAHYFSCAPGLHFNRNSQVCEWPVYAGCAPPPPPVPTTQPPPSSSPRCQNVVCPAQNNEKYATPVANPGSCTSYCQCDWGVAYYFDCPSGLRFNKDVSQCDFAWRTPCQL